MAQDDAESPLKRWSRRKLEEQERRRQPAAPRAQPDDAMPASPPAPGADKPAEAPPDLPPIESLTKESDFTVFMREGVPEELRQEALRKLWRSDPVLANLDGLLEYGEDFAEPFKTGAVVSTLYRVGKGMVDAVDEIADAGAPGESQLPTAAPQALAAAKDTDADRASERSEADAGTTPEPEKDA